MHSGMTFSMMYEALERMMQCAVSEKAVVERCTG